MHPVCLHKDSHCQETQQQRERDQDFAWENELARYIKLLCLALAGAKWSPQGQQAVREESRLPGKGSSGESPCCWAERAYWQMAEGDFVVVSPQDCYAKQTCAPAEPFRSPPQ